MDFRGEHSNGQMHGQTGSWIPIRHFADGIIIIRIMIKRKVAELSGCVFQDPT